MNYIKIYEERKNTVERSSNEHRDEAFKAFERKGIPDGSDEKYKYTPLKAIFDAEYRFASEPTPLSEESREKLKASIPDLDAYAIYAVNGFAERPVYETEEGITLCALSHACKSTPDTVSEYYDSLAFDADDAPASLNTALAADGIFVRVGADVLASKPLLIVNTTAASHPTFTQQRNLFVFEEGCQARLVICNVNFAGDIVLSNDVSEIIIKKNARVDIVRIHRESETSMHVASDFARQETKSSFEHANIVLGGDLVRNNVEVHLTGERCENRLHGLTIAGGKRHIDNRTFVNHAAPECESAELYKSIIGGRAVNVFNGRILVGRNAQKTSAFQSNRNVLLSDDAKVHTEPRLEIYADDVKCSHGAVVGRLDVDALFYMQARGIGKKHAGLLLTAGFAGEISAKIRIPELRDYLSDMIDESLCKLYT